MTVRRENEKSARANKIRSTTLVVDLKDLKAPWSAWCAIQNLTPSEAVRRALGEVLRSAGVVQGTAGPGKALTEGERKRIELRVSADELAAIVSAAANEGMSVPRWMHALLAVHLLKRAQFGAPEVEALVKSSQALLAIGRGLNQIVREMPGAPSVSELSLAQIAFLTDLIKSHTKEVSQLLTANARRWTS